MKDAEINHAHVDKSEIRKDLIGYDADGRCAKCHGELEQGYGLAGGGIGVYDYCPKCGDIVSKTEDHS